MNIVGDKIVCFSLNRACHDRVVVRIIEHDRKDRLRGYFDRFRQFDQQGQKLRNHLTLNPSFQKLLGDFVE